MAEIQFQMTILTEVAVSTKKHYLQHPLSLSRIYAESALMSAWAPAVEDAGF